MEILAETEQWRNNYRNGLRAGVRGLWAGVLDYYQAYDAVMTAITDGFTHAWWDGAEDAGIRPEELSPEEQQALQSEIAKQMGYVDGLLQAVEAGSKANGGKLQPLLDRVERFWVSRYDDVENKARAMAGTDVKYKWVLSKAEHCSSCLKLEGKIKRASFWKQAGLFPNCPQLECVRSAGGIPVCKCQFEKTDEPASPGPLPSI